MSSVEQARKKMKPTFLPSFHNSRSTLFTVSSKSVRHQQALKTEILCRSNKAADRQAHFRPIYRSLGWAEDYLGQYYHCDSQLYPPL